MIFRDATIEIPDGLIFAHEEGRVVFFCGAASHHLLPCGKIPPCASKCLSQIEAADDKGRICNSDLYRKIRTRIDTVGG